MQKVLFDLFSSQPNDGAKRHGGGRYGEVVLRRIVERGLSVSCFYDSSKWLNPDMSLLLSENKVPLYDISKATLPDIVRKGGFSIVYSPLPLDMPATNLGCEVIGTIHGLRRLETRVDWHAFRYKSKWKEYLRLCIVKMFPHIGLNREYKDFGSLAEKEKFRFVVVSNHTKNSLQVYFPKYRDLNIPVFYSPSTSSAKKIETKIFDKYFLIVSANRWEKNALRSIMALDRLFSIGFLSDYRVKVTGAKGMSNFRYTLKNPERFDFLGYVKDEELDQLYHDAYALIYMSLNEGFGYPPLEAMHYGVPVVASPFTSIPEVCGDAVLYANPYSLEEIMNRIVSLTDEKVYSSRSDMSFKRYEYITNRQGEDLDKLIDYIFSDNKE